MIMNNLHFTVRRLGNVLNCDSDEKKDEYDPMDPNPDKTHPEDEY